MFLHAWVIRHLNPWELPVTVGLAVLGAGSALVALLVLYLDLAHLHEASSRDVPGLGLSSPLMIASFLATLGGLRVFLRVHQRNSLRQTFRVRQDLHAEEVWCFSDGRIRITGTKSTFDTDWSVFAKVAHLPEGFIFFNHANSSYWLPREGFDSQEDIDRLDALARERVTRFVDATKEGRGGIR